MMQLCKAQLESGEVRVGVVADGHVRLLNTRVGSLSDVLHSNNPATRASDIDGENPSYLPQARVYDQCCALGPVVTLADAMPPLKQVGIQLTIERGGKKVFEGATSLEKMARGFDDLIDWLGRDNSFPNG